MKSKAPMVNGWMDGWILYIYIMDGRKDMKGIKRKAASSFLHHYTAPVTIFPQPYTLNPRHRCPAPVDHLLATQENHRCIATECIPTMRFIKWFAAHPPCVNSQDTHFSAWG